VHTYQTLRRQAPGDGFLIAITPETKKPHKDLIIIIIIIIIIIMTGAISKSFRKYVSNIPGNHEVKELQNTAILATAHILRKVLT
jgi:flagellar basal body-associated protein FliL